MKSMNSWLRRPWIMGAIFFAIFLGIPLYKGEDPGEAMIVAVGLGLLAVGVSYLVSRPEGDRRSDASNTPKDG